MSLQAKFGVLLGILGLIVLMALGLAWWSLGVVQREVQAPFRSMSVVLTSLERVKRCVNTQASLVLPGPPAQGAAPDPESAETPRLVVIDARADEIERLVGTIRETEWALSHTGKSAFANLRQRAEDWNAIARRLAAEGSPAPDAGAADAAARLLDLIARIESRLVVETEAALLYGREVRARLLTILGLSAAAALLTSGLGLALVRRWVLGPVAALRAAAARIGAGDFDHRIPVDPRRARDELARLSLELNHMAGMVKQMQDERVDRERLAAVGEMVRRLVHNLRNPLGGIRGLAEITRADARSIGPHAQDIAEAQDRIITAVDRFEKWLSDLLNVTRPATVQPEPGDPRSLLTGLVEAHRPMALSRGVQLHLDQLRAPEQARFDHRHLEQALAAILSNAIEATASVNPATGRVVVTSDILKTGEGGPVWEIRVQDQGPGVPEHLRQVIFKPYFTTKRDGNGIGLALALQVVRAHGGAISVGDPADTAPAGATRPHGAVFTVHIPLAADLRPAQELASIGRLGAAVGQDSGH